MGPAPLLGPLLVCLPSSADNYEITHKALLVNYGQPGDC